MEVRMKSLQWIWILVGLVVAAPAHAMGPEMGRTDVVFAQNGREMVLERDAGEIFVEASPFSLFFCNWPYDGKRGYHPSARVSVFREASTFAQVVSGLQAKETPCFGRWSSFPAGPLGYESLFLDDGANHYLIYGEGETDRLQLVERLEDGMLKLEFPVFGFHENGEIPVEQMKGERIFLVIFVDRNVNDIIEADELTRVVLGF